jgi:hypothetical protein
MAFTEEAELSDDGYDGAGSATTEVDEIGETLAARETKAVNAGKALVFGVLLLAAVAMGWLTYWFTSEDEQNAFESSVGFNSLSPHYQGLIFTERLTPRDLSCS